MGGVRTQAFAGRQVVQAGITALHVGAPHSSRDRQGQEPLAQCGRPLWCSPPVLRDEGDELLHRAVRRLARAGSAPRATQVHVHPRPQETGWRLEPSLLPISVPSFGYLAVVQQILVNYVVIIFTELFF